MKKCIVFQQLVIVLSMYNQMPINAKNKIGNREHLTEKNKIDKQSNT